MVSNPKPCDCGSQIFRPIWAVTHKDSDESNDNLDPLEGNTMKYQVGHECVECGNIQLTRKVPDRHDNNNDLSLPDGANYDFINS